MGGFGGKLLELELGSKSSRRGDVPGACLGVFVLFLSAVGLDFGALGGNHGRRGAKSRLGTTGKQELGGEGGWGGGGGVRDVCVWQFNIIIRVILKY